MSIEMPDGVPWIFGQRSCGELPGTPVHGVLRWVLEQLNFGHFLVERDGSGDGVSLTLGQAAAFASPVPPDRKERRERAVMLAGLLAKARERGIEPDWEYFSDKANPILRNTETGRMNTEFHYAFQLVDILADISELTHRLESPPILGRADPDIVSMLGEATRCLMLGLARSSTAVCRACMEAALKDHVSPREVWTEQEGYPHPDGSKRGQLECLIRVAERSDLLDRALSDAAHKVRRAGNDAAHGDVQTADGWDTLLRTRQVVEHLYR